MTTVAGQSVVTNNERLTILFLVQGLEIGGAERQLVTLARGLRRRGHRVIVVPFYEGGPLRQGLIAERVEILDLKKAGRWDVVPFVFRLLRTIRVVKPEVIYSFLTVPNILLAAIKLLIPGAARLGGYVLQEWICPGMIASFALLIWLSVYWLGCQIKLLSIQERRCRFSKARGIQQTG